MIRVRPLMTMTTTVVVVVLVAVLAAAVAGQAVVSDRHHSGRVLLVSMDGFRWDYITKVSGLRHFRRLAASGCSVDYAIPPFATKTFPSHYTIATGLYEESHGIVANHMYDPVRNAYFNKASKESFWWEGGEPIWVTAEKQKKSTGVYFWVGSESEIRGYRPSIYVPYNQSVPFPQRVHTALSWLKSDRKDLVLLYFHEPDFTGHKFGPDSPEVAQKVREMDDILGLILTTMEKMELNDVNLIVTSDHGMTTVNAKDRLLDLWHYVNRSLVEVVPDSGTVTPILPKAGRKEEVLEAARKIPHVTVYRKEDMPHHFHYKKNARILPILILSDEGWLLTSNYQKALAKNEKGDHGYSNQLPSMRPIFFARGPDFKKGVTATSIRSIDIYPLVCRLLNIQPAPNNGTIRTEFLENDTGHSKACGPLTWLCVGLLVLLSDWFSI